MIHLSQSRPATVFSIVSMEIGASYKSGFEIALRRRRRRRRPRDPDSIGVSFGGVGLLYSRRVTGIKWGMIKITRLRVRVSSRDPLLGEGARGERVAFANRGGDGNWRWEGGGWYCAETMWRPTPLSVCYLVPPACTTTSIDALAPTLSTFDPSLEPGWRGWIRRTM